MRVSIPSLGREGDLCCIKIYTAGLATEKKADEILRPAPHQLLSIF